MEKKYIIFLVSVIAVTLVLFFGIDAYEDYVAELPYYGPTEQVEGEDLYHTVPDFSMENQKARKVTLSELDDKVGVVNFFFTSCPTICPRMMRNLQTVQELYLNDPQVGILSFSVDPKRDTPERLAEFARAYHIDDNMWQLLTGSKKEIYALARNGFYLTASQGDGGDHDFIHSENLVLLDKQKRIRGYYDGTDPLEVEQLIKDISKLKRSKT